MFAAYKYVITAILVAEASFYANQLHLPLHLPIQTNELTFQLIDLPDTMYPLGAGGRIDVEGYSFSFSSRDRFIRKLNPFPGASMAEENELLSHGNSLVDTNGAYLLASNWLDEIQVDVRELEKTNHPEVRQRWCYSPNAGKVLLPIFEVRWGNWNDPKVNVTVDGRTKEMVYISQNDFSFSGKVADLEKTLSSFSRRPAELIKHLDNVLAIPDEAFEHYSDSEHSNLVGQFSVVDYRHPADVRGIAHRYDVTNDYKAIFYKFSEAGREFSRLKESENAKKSTNSP